MTRPGTLLAHFNSAACTGRWDFRLYISECKVGWNCLKSTVDGWSLRENCYDSFEFVREHRPQYDRVVR
jgi:hypothetical protein